MSDKPTPVPGGISFAPDYKSERPSAWEALTEREREAAKAAFLRPSESELESYRQTLHLMAQSSPAYWREKYEAAKRERDASLEREAEEVKALRAKVAEEREACAQVAETWPLGGHWLATGIARAIRARGR